MSIVYLSSLCLWPALNRLRRPIAWRYIPIATLSGTGPLVTQGAHAKRPLGHRCGGRVAFVLWETSMVSDLWSSGLLCVQCRRQGIDFAFQFGDATVGFLLAFPRGRRYDTW